MNQHQPFFSIIIPTYGRPRQLTACLQSLTRLDYSRHCFEVIVVDDGSETSPQAAITTFRDQLEVTLLQLSHAGPATARNAGAMKARGTFLAFTDDDCKPAPDWLMTLAARFAKTPDYAIGGRTFNALRNNRYSSASQLLIDYLYTYYNADRGQARFFASNNLALPRERFHAIGGFNAGWPLAAGEDRELCDRWLSNGYGMIYAPEVIVYHAHALTLRTFCRQHFNYGRGAHYFHQTRACRGQSPVKVEPPSFYVDLLRYPFFHASYRQAPLLSALLAITQVANVAGFISELGRRHREQS